MSERYSRLFSLSENLYAAGSPVVIAAGALLKDNQTGKVIAQLKLRSIHSKVIKAVTVSIAPLNTAGNPLGNEVRYEYLDLKIGRDKKFGQKTPIALPDASTRSFCVKVVEVVFDDNDLWNASEAPWEPLPTPSSIGTVHGAEFEKQFHLKYGSDSKNIPLLVKDLWFCSCGALNRQEEFCCYSCKKAFADMAAYNEARLLEEMNQRLADEKAKAEQEAEAARIEAEQKAEAARLKAEKNRRKAKELAQKSKKPAMIAALIVAALLLSVNVILPAIKYARADRLVEKGQYTQAIEIYSGMKASEKRDTRIAAAHYASAESLLAQKEFDKARLQFTKAGNYKDAVQRIFATHYAYAEDLLAQKEYEKAVEAFGKASPYKDAKQRISETYYAYAEDLLAQKEYDKAVEQFKKAGDYEDAHERVSGTYYAYAENLLAQKEFANAIDQFRKAGSYSDAKERIKETTYLYAEHLLSEEDFDNAISRFAVLGKYKDAQEKMMLAKYASAEALVAQHQRYKAYQTFMALNDYQDAKERAAQLKAELEKAVSVQFVYFNSSKNDTTKLSTTYSSTSTSFDYLHYGFLVEGLYPGETIELIQTYTDPGKKEILSGSTWRDVTSGQTVEHTWGNGHNLGSYGTFKIEVHIFDNQQTASDADTPVGSYSFTLKKAQEGNLWAGLHATSSGY